MVALMALTHEKLGQSLLLVLGVFRLVRLKDDRQNSATGAADVADRLGRPAIKFQQIEVFSQAVQRRLVLQAGAHTVFHGLVDFCMWRGHQRQPTYGARNNSPITIIFMTDWANNANLGSSRLCRKPRLGEGDRHIFAPRTLQNWDSPRRFSDTLFREMLVE